MRAVKLTDTIAAVFTAIALGTGAGHAHELEEVKQVFEHALPRYLSQLDSDASS